LKPVRMGAERERRQMPLVDVRSRLAFGHSARWVGYEGCRKHNKGKQSDTESGTSVSYHDRSPVHGHSPGAIPDNMRHLSTISCKTPPNHQLRLESKETSAVDCS
jgi:hypothetical protein